MPNNFLQHTCVSKVRYLFFFSVNTIAILRLNLRIPISVDPNFNLFQSTIQHPTNQCNVQIKMPFDINLGERWISHKVWQGCNISVSPSILQRN